MYLSLLLYTYFPAHRMSRKSWGALAPPPAGSRSKYIYIYIQHTYYVYIV